MEDVERSSSRWCLPEDAARVREDSEFRFIMVRWPAVAAVAWAGFLLKGPGTVMLDDEGCISYVDRELPEVNPELLQDYDPSTQVLVALHVGEEIDAVHKVSGWPEPPDACRVTPFERTRLTRH